jgi:hypothetical protein
LRIWDHPGSGCGGFLDLQAERAGRQAQPPPVACGGKNERVCADQPMARVIDLIRRVDWPNYDLF